MNICIYLGIYVNTHQSIYLYLGCDWDNGDCNKVFENAAADALLGCACSPTVLWGSVQNCDAGAQGVGQEFACYSASCDWAPFVFCEERRYICLYDVCV